MLSVVFCGGHFEFQIRGLTMRGLGPNFKKSGTGRRIRKFQRFLRAPSVFRNFGSGPRRPRIKNVKWPPQKQKTRTIKVGLWRRQGSLCPNGKTQPRSQYPQLLSLRGTGNEIWQKTAYFFISYISHKCWQWNVSSLDGVFNVSMTTISVFDRSSMDDMQTVLLKADPRPAAQSWFSTCFCPAVNPTTVSFNSFTLLWVLVSVGRMLFR